MSRLYRNPVHPGYFADPFVLKIGNGYLAWGTGRMLGRPRLRDPALARPGPLGVRSAARSSGSPGASRPNSVPTTGRRRSSPADGRWWMYYSVGRGDVGHSLRVAVADEPAGPYRDLGVDLTPDERFAIDPHPFVDADGTRYLFYARDVLEGPRVGTMLAVDVLDGMDPARRAAAPPSSRRPATGRSSAAGGRCTASVYDWHTLEGPFVRRRQGAVRALLLGRELGGADVRRRLGLRARTRSGPGASQPGPAALLRTVPGHVVGPGHNCVVVGPGRAGRRSSTTPGTPERDGPPALHRPARLDARRARWSTVRPGRVRPAALRRRRRLNPGPARDLHNARRLAL